MRAATHETSTFALTTACAAGLGVPPLGCVLLGLVGAWFADWPDIDHDRARATQTLCLVRYPVVRLRNVWPPWKPWVDAIRARLKGSKRRGRKKAIVWRSFPGHQIHVAITALSGWVFDRCATEADRKRHTWLWGPRYRTHRGLTHSVWFALATGAGVWFALGGVGEVLAAWWPSAYAADWSPIFGPDGPRWLLTWSAIVGTVGHVLGDCCTDYGCAPLAPLWRWDGHRYVEMGLWKPLRFKVDGWVENSVVMWVCTAAAGASVLLAFGWLVPLGDALGKIYTALG